MGFASANSTSSPLDDTMLWDCSSKGWHCCVDFRHPGETLRPHPPPTLDRQDLTRAHQRTRRHLPVGWRWAGCLAHRSSVAAPARSRSRPRSATSRSIEEFWLADLLWRATKSYLISRGLTNSTDTNYRALPLDEPDRLELWGGCFTPGILSEVTERFENQWQLDTDLDGDRAPLRLVLTATLDRVDTLVAESGVAIEDLGLAGEPPMTRPDLDALSDTSLPMLPVIAVAA